MAPSLHPAVDNGISPGFGSFNGGTLYCKCASDKVAVQIAGDVAYNHACGVVDEKAAIQRHACKQCCVHMYGRIVTDHPFKGFDFVHSELSPQKGWQAPQFAAFCSSIIEQGYEPSGMEAVRSKFHSMGLDTYDCLAPGLMDAIATYTSQKQGTAYDPSKPAGAQAPKPNVAAGSATTPAAKPTSTSAAPPPVAKQGGIAGFFARLFGG